MTLLPLPKPSSEHRLTATEFQQLSALPAITEWFINIRNPQTRRAYQNDLSDFCHFIGIDNESQFRSITRAHVLAWRTSLEQKNLSPATIRRKLAALTSLFDYLLNQNAVSGGNPVEGVKRPAIESSEGKTPALGDFQAKALLDAPDFNTVKGKRDRAILSILLYHGLRREEAAALCGDDIQERRGIKHLRVRGKGGKLRYLPLHPVSAERIYLYLQACGRATSHEPLFQALRGPKSKSGITADGIYRLVGQYTQQAGIEVRGLGVHGLRATAATNALENEADIAKVQAWLGHANISTTRIYDRRQSRPEDSPTFKVRY